MVNPFVLLVPYLLAMLYALIGKNGKNKHVGYVGSLAGIVTIILMFFVGTGFWSTNWFSVAGYVFELSFLLDTIGSLLVYVIGGIGAFVFFYSVGYLGKHEDLRRYYFLLSLFAMSMIGVVSAGNLFQMFFFWELVGVSSFLLIGFWHHKQAAVDASRKAFITIIVGDVFFLAGIFLLWLNYGTFDIQTILQSLQADKLTLFAGAGIIIGGISKSAQFPLHDWLPDAMEGPTPVSAFLHSATMVKAGLFVIARFLPLLVIVGLTKWLLAIAVITILISGLLALVEYDIKRVLAYSTMNQLAFILLGLSLGALSAGMFHLLTHSVFKALLFFSAGIAIHAAGSQDLRSIHLKFGWNAFTVSTVIGVLGLAGLIPFSGFFSKEAILESVLHARIEIVLFFCLAIFVSAAYIFRWLFLLMGKKQVKSNFQMLAPLPVLAFLTVVGGLGASAFFGLWGEEMHFFGMSAILSTILVLAGAVIAYLIYVRKWHIEWLSQSTFAEICRERFLVDRLYVFCGEVFAAIGVLCKKIDDGLINRAVRGSGEFFVLMGNYFRKFHSGSVQTYVFASVLGFIVLAIVLGVLV